MISVIIPIYNGEHCIAHTIQCLQNQQFSDFEALLVNDGSTDRTHDICANVALSDPRFRLVDQPNGGVSAARNHGLQVAVGKYVTFLDADDTIPSNYLQELYHALSEHDAQLAVCDVAIITDGEETNRFTCLLKSLSQAEALNRLLSRREINSGPYAKLFLRDVLKDLKFPPLKAYEDILFVAEAMAHCQKIAVTSCTEYDYAQNQNSAMSSFKKAPSLDVVRASDQLTQLLAKRNDLSADCLYATLSHLMQYVLPLLGKPDQQSQSFVTESQHLMRRQVSSILRCSAFPWKEKIIFTMFAYGWQYRNKKISRI